MGYKNVVFESNSVFLVTGGAGFIGSNLCEALLKKGYAVKCLDNLSTGKSDNIKELLLNQNFEFIKGDITDFETCLKACENVDYVLHQAAWGSVPRSIEMPMLYNEINVKGTLNMLEASVQCKVKKFVFASSSSVYGDDATLPKMEGNEGFVLSPYALTKKTNEEYARLYNKLYGLETYGLRYFNVFGKRQDSNGAYAAVIPKFIIQLLENKTSIINGDGYHSRDFTYIENVIEANLKACQATSVSAGEVFNIAYGGNEYIIDVHKILAKSLNKDIRPKFGPNRSGDIKASHADISKAKRLLGYDPDWNFTTGILETIEWYKHNYE